MYVSLIKFKLKLIIKYKNKNKKKLQKFIDTFSENYK